MAFINVVIMGQPIVYATQSNYCENMRFLPWEIARLADPIPPIPQCRAFRAVKTLTRRKMDGPICHTNTWRLKSNQICVYCGRGCVDWYEWSASWFLMCLLWNNNRRQKTPQQNRKFYIVPSSQFATHWHSVIFPPYPENSCLWPELAENGSCLCRPAYRLTPGAVLAKSIFI